MTLCAYFQTLCKQQDVPAPEAHADKMSIYKQTEQTHHRFAVPFIYHSTFVCHADGSRYSKHCSTPLTACFQQPWSVALAARTNFGRAWLDLTLTDK